MGCFSLFPCFTSSKHQKLNKYSSSSADQGCKKNRQTVLIKVPTEESTNIGSLQSPVSKSRDNSEGQVINGSDNKTPAIDLDVEIIKDISTEHVEILSVESKEDNEKKVKEECGKLGVLVQLENAKERDNVNNKENGKLGVVENKNSSGVQVEIENDNKIEMVLEEKNKTFGVRMDLENGSDREKEAKTEVHSRAISDSSVSSYISYPPMHRYHNSVINEDEDQVVIQEDSSELLFSLSIDPRRQSKSCPVEVNDKEVNSPLKTTSCPNENDNNQTIDSLLNPIENLAQWKTLNAMPPPPSFDLHQEKENFYLEQEDIPIPVSEDPSFKVSDQKGKVKNNTAVTTSLSSWLVDPEKSITASKDESQYSTGNSYSYSDATSWKSFEDRPILGAWTIDEVKQISARSSPRKSPCRNPDETPIIGTVGSYWSHTMQATDSSSSCTSPLVMSSKSRRNRQIHSDSLRKFKVVYPFQSSWSQWLKNRVSVFGRHCPLAFCFRLGFGFGSGLGGDDEGTPTTDPAVTWWIAFTSRLRPKQREGEGEEDGNDDESVDDARREWRVTDE
ncbi:hypothetical protein L1987_34861 [Smallanthus sonchifolius]|uniref:Uncharacterized protein n=1 Tax=Smallanthus sonchifolius TaxID=185202 RepID=A0ACB9HVD8_9ASTR|nr:hypothetical protein L1987_34861 [Smallanthus sonchifolius]